jgi:diaminopropionate ammonia-lyase
VTVEKPITWIENPRARSIVDSGAVRRLFPPGISQEARRFHRQIPDYSRTPLKSLANLAQFLGLGSIWVKDEAVRLNLGSFKVLGGSFAIYRFIQQRLGRTDELSFEELSSPELRRQLGDITFAAATDGNHGRGIAWAATKLGFKSVIYVHKYTSEARIHAIERNGAEVVVIDGIYDDAVRQINEDAQRNGWQVVSDTSWEGYTDIPKWVMQGYSTMFAEAQEQLAAIGATKPTHLIAQAGVGSLAASMIGFYTQLFGADRPTTVVVEPDRAACLFRSAEIGDGKPYGFPGDLDTIMAGLACGDPNPIAWELLWDTTDFFLKCPDYVAAKGMRVYGVPLNGDPYIIAGESGAVTLGALTFLMELPEYAELRDKIGLGPNACVLLVNSERNTDPDAFRRVVWEAGDAVPVEYRRYPRHTNRFFFFFCCFFCCGWGLFPPPQPHPRTLSKLTKLAKGVSELRDFNQACQLIFQGQFAMLNLDDRDRRMLHHTDDATRCQPVGLQLCQAFGR